MVVGPPGTGKTDTAVQIMHVLYHNCPGQRTLLIAHSNQALNDLFQKIMERDVPARYLLRLGGWLGPVGGACGACGWRTWGLWVAHVGPLGGSYAWVEAVGSLMEKKGLFHAYQSRVLRFAPQHR